MRKSENSPHGVTEPIRHQHGISVSSGWRHVSPALVQGEKLADIGANVAIEKGRAVVAIKRVGAHIGLKAADMMLLDTLGAFTHAKDWEQGRRPIVWASNAYLMEQTGFSLSALKRHTRRLAEIGAIAFKDSPNGKRWGHRDADGVIVEAYGFDLSPLAARAEEFEELHAQLLEERALCRQLKRQITVARRMIRARIEAALSGALRGPWAHLVGVFEDLLNRLPLRKETSDALAGIFMRFKDLQETVEGAYLKFVEPEKEVLNCGDGTEVLMKDIKKLDPREPIFEPNILITNQLHSVTCNSSETKEVGQVGSETLSDASIDGGLEDWVAEVRTKRIALDVPVVMQACPEFASWARNIGGYLRDWSDLHRVAGKLSPMIGISEHAWDAAQERLGKQGATAALILVFEKHSAGEVTSPGGYLRGMVEKAGAGKLHLERSFFGRLNAMAA